MCGRWDYPVIVGDVVLQLGHEELLELRGLARALSRVVLLLLLLQGALQSQGALAEGQQVGGSPGAGKHEVNRGHLIEARHYRLHNCSKRRTWHKRKGKMGN